MSVKDVNRIPELVKQLRSLDYRKVRIGINAPSGDKLYMIGWVHEFGMDIEVTEKMRGWFLAQGMPLSNDTTKISIPERSFMRAGFDHNKSKIDQKAAELIDLVLQGEMTAYAAREALGTFAAECIQDNVVDVNLVKTGELKDSIGFRVVKK